METAKKPLHFSPAATHNGADVPKLPCGCPDDDRTDKFWDMTFVTLGGKGVKFVIRQCNNCGRNLTGDIKAVVEEEPLIVGATSIDRSS